MKKSIENIGSEKSALCASFRSTLGPQGLVVFLLKHNNFDDAVDFRTLWLSNKGESTKIQFPIVTLLSNVLSWIADTNLEGVKNFETKALVPLKFSPMQ